MQIGALTGDGENDPISKSTNRVDFGKMHQGGFVPTRLNGF